MGLHCPSLRCCDQHHAHEVPAQRSSSRLCFLCGSQIFMLWFVYFFGLSWKSAHTDTDNLSLVLQDPTHSWSGGLDAQLKTHDLNTDQGLWAAVSKVTLNCLLEIFAWFLFICVFYFLCTWNECFLLSPPLKQIQLLEHTMPLFVAWNIAQRSMSWWLVAGTDQFDCGTQEHLAMLAPSLSQKRWSNRELSRTCPQAPCLNIHAMERFNQKMACGQLLQINNV